MSDVWTYGEKVMSGPLDLTGFTVEATDGEIGKIDEATYAPGNSYVVVDTGFWIFGKKRMIPAQVVTRVEVDRRTVRVNLSKDEIKSAPDYDHERSPQPDYRKLVSGYYDDLLAPGYGDRSLR